MNLGLKLTDYLIILLVIAAIILEVLAIDSWIDGKRSMINDTAEIAQKTRVSIPHGYLGWTKKEEGK